MKAAWLIAVCIAAFELRRMRKAGMRARPAAIAIWLACLVYLGYAAFAHTLPLPFGIVKGLFGWADHIAGAS